ncbi:hypothetical protein GCM10027052_17640 [Parafrigoribacterium mesophilum]
MRQRTETAEATITIGADGFSYTREGEPMPDYKLGSQVQPVGRPVCTGRPPRPGQSSARTSRSPPSHDV